MGRQIANVETLRHQDCQIPVGLQLVDPARPKRLPHVLRSSVYGIRLHTRNGRVVQDAEASGQGAGLRPGSSRGGGRGRLTRAVEYRNLPERLSVPRALDHEGPGIRRSEVDDVHPTPRRSVGMDLVTGELYSCRGRGPPCREVGGMVGVIALIRTGTLPDLVGSRGPTELPGH